MNNDLIGRKAWAEVMKLMSVILMVGADHGKYSGMYDASSSKLKANVISI